MKILRFTAFLLAASFCQVAFAAGGYWVWKDANGVTNFSQQKPKNHAARHVLGNGPYGYKETLEDSRRPGMAPPPPMKSEQRKTPKSGQQPGSTVNPDKVVASQRAKIEQKIAAIKRKNCIQARKNLTQLDRPRVRMTGKDGKVYVLSPKQQQARREAAQKAIQSNCG